MACQNIDFNKAGHVFPSSSFNFQAMVKGNYAMVGTKKEKKENASEQNVRSSGL